MVVRMTAREAREQFGIEVKRRRGAAAPGAGGQSELEATFALQAMAEGLPEPVREYVFNASRGWRFDFAWPAVHVAVEIDGHDHQMNERYHGDIEKFNRAALLGWAVLHVTRGLLENLEGVAAAANALEMRGVACGRDGEGQTVSARLTPAQIAYWLTEDDGAGEEMRREEQHLREILGRVYGGYRSVMSKELRSEIEAAIGTEGRK
jgi:hypothetical protein